MKPVLEHVPYEVKESFIVRQFSSAYYSTPWHFHPEYEIVLITESTGKRFIGDQIADFQSGDLALLGPYLPHLYRNGPAFYEEKNNLQASSIVVHFLENSLGTDFFYYPKLP